jgi:endonuclease/exonuclease/phosphatase family metal-dependent hydrolase
MLVVSWNTAVGDADVVELVRRLRVANGTDILLVLLLQETYRRGSDVPSTLPAAASFAGQLGHRAATLKTRDIASIAEATQLWAYYVPSMRNGGAESNEDRGNAILSSLPLTNVSAIELPFEGQRRVAVAATVAGATSTGTRWSLRVVSAHLDNMVGPRRLWFAGGEYARARQARALVSFLADADAAVLGGDFNTWFGFGDLAYTEMALAFPGSRPRDPRPTFRNLLRLDHVFFRLPPGWQADVRRGNERLGSDHYPLISTVRTASTTCAIRDSDVAGHSSEYLAPRRGEPRRLVVGPPLIEWI